MMNSADTLRIDGISKLTKIEDLRERLVEHFNAPIEKQMLIYRGKQLINGHTLFDYDIGLNDTVQILVRNAPPPSPQKTEEKKEDGTEPKEEAMEEEGALEDELEVEVLEKATYKLGDIIDAKDDDGAWYEADILKITKNAKSPVWSNGKDSNANENDVKSKESASSSLKPLPEGYVEDDGFFYHIKYEGFEEDDPVKLAAKNVRPRARNKLKLEKINVGDRVMVNYNYDEPTSRGYWYDAIVTAKRCTRTIKEVEATVFFGKDLVPLEKCKIAFWWDIFAVEEPGTQINKITDANAALQTPQKREQKPNCVNCKDNPKKKCKECACRKCGGKDELEKQLMCDECNGAYHIWCLNPPLEAIPDVDEWFCPECKNDSSEIVQKGEKLKANKKNAKMASANSTSTRDWGKGMACAGKTKDCSIVPPNHLGPVPGVEVGSMWKFRLGVSEAGIHRPHVAGIHGREDDGAFSLVLSGGYEDDEDDGEEFSYTGSGGRDLSGNKRTAEQSCDQTLTRMNRALAKNCNAPIDKVNGAEAKDWKKGKPVRVVRNCKGRKHSKYAPEEGNRYDGIYKVVKYWPSKGKSGFIVWRYLLRRDDPVPAPWTKAGKKRIAELGLEMQYPEGYIEKEKEKEEKKKKAKDDENTGKSPKGRGRGKKRQRIDSSDEENQSEGESPNPSPVKKMKKAEYQLNEVVAKLIDKDKNNRKIWDEALGFRSEGAKGFLAKVEELFSCVCCQDIVFQPITTSCSHNVCKSCLQRSFKAEVYSCPACRHELGKDYSLAMNKSLKEALNLLFPGYEAGR